jgi:hypothetical protein
VKGRIDALALWVMCGPIAPGLDKLVPGIRRRPVRMAVGRPPFLHLNDSMEVATREIGSNGPSLSTLAVRDEAPTEAGAPSVLLVLFAAALDSVAGLPRRV